MQELEKILEEIGSEFDRRINIQLKIMAGLVMMYTDTDMGRALNPTNRENYLLQKSSAST